MNRIPNLETATLVSLSRDDRLLYGRAFANLGRARESWAGSTAVARFNRSFFYVWILAIAALGIAPAGASPPADAAQTLNPDGSLQIEMASRIPWTNSHLTGSAEPPLPYRVRRVFARLQFREPVDLLSASNLGRLFIAERTGKVFSFTNDDQVAEPNLAIDLGKEVPAFTQLYGMTLDPGFATNSFIYLCYVLRDGAPEGSHLSRFKVSRSDPPRIDPQSEKIIMTWLSGGHNGGCLKFGPDGYLYISTGDGRGPDPPDALDAGQDISRPLSGILRIDVNRQEGSRRYGVPADNPFLHQAGACPEKWAYGLRNPWKMSFDQEKGDLWVGDVGYETWEMIYRVERGGNYGWSIVEGPKPIKPNGPRGPTLEATSIAGGGWPASRALTFMETGSRAESGGCAMTASRLPGSANWPAPRCS